MSPPVGLAASLAGGGGAALLAAAAAFSSGSRYAGNGRSSLCKGRRDDGVRIFSRGIDILTTPVGGTLAGRGGSLSVDVSTGGPTVVDNGETG